MIYWASSGGASNADIQKRNLEFAARELEKCSSRGESFVYVVPAFIIFDMTILGVHYTENSPVDPSCYAGQVCLTAENMIYDYEYGYVVRTMPLIDSGVVFDRIEMMRHGHYDDRKVSDTSFQFSSRHVIEDVADNIVNNSNTTFPKIQHLFSAIRFTTSYIAFQMLGEDHNIEFDPSGEIIFQELSSSLNTSKLEGRNAHRLANWTFEVGENIVNGLKCQKVI